MLFFKVLSVNNNVAQFAIIGYDCFAFIFLKRTEQKYRTYNSFLLNMLNIHSTLQSNQHEKKVKKTASKILNLEYFLSIIYWLHS